MKNTKHFSLALLLTIVLSPSISHASDVCTNLQSNIGRGASDKTSVSSLQQYLYNNSFLSVAPTGFFGNLTYLAVKKFQTTNNISSTGFVGPLTRTLIKNNTCGVTSTAGGNNAQGVVNLNTSSLTVSPVTLTISGNSTTVDAASGYYNKTISFSSTKPVSSWKLMFRCTPGSDLSVIPDTFCTYPYTINATGNTYNKDFTFTNGSSAPRNIQARLEAYASGGSMIGYSEGWVVVGGVQPIDSIIAQTAINNSANGSGSSNSSIDIPLAPGQPDVNSPEQKNLVKRYWDASDACRIFGLETFDAFGSYKCTPKETSETYKGLVKGCSDLAAVLGEAPGTTDFDESIGECTNLHTRAIIEKPCPVGQKWYPNGGSCGYEDRSHNTAVSRMASSTDSYNANIEVPIYGDTTKAGAWYRGYRIGDTMNVVWNRMPEAACTGGFSYCDYTQVFLVSNLGLLASIPISDKLATSSPTHLSIKLTTDIMKKISIEMSNPNLDTGTSKDSRSKEYMIFVETMVNQGRAAYGDSFKGMHGAMGYSYIFNIK